jgi:5-methylcytosine-specific restriction enzyme A
MIARLCLGTAGASCSAIVPAGTRRCSPCLAVHNRTRNAAQRDRKGGREARGYSWSWRKLSVVYRRRNPICELRYAGCTLVATEVDHTVPIRAGGRSVRANCTAVCRPCHRIKTIKDQEKYPE